VSELTKDPILLDIVDDVRNYFQTTSDYYYIPNLTADGVIL